MLQHCFGWVHFNFVVAGFQLHLLTFIHLCCQQALKFIVAGFQFPFFPPNEDQLSTNHGPPFVLLTAGTHQLPGGVWRDYGHCHRESDRP